MQSVLWKKILAMSREGNLVISVGLNDRGTGPGYNPPNTSAPLPRHSSTAHELSERMGFL